MWLEAGQLLVTLSDLTSDARILVRIDLATGAIRKRQIQVPMAFGASDPQGGRLLAYRDIPGAEFAIYSWREINTRASRAARKLARQESNQPRSADGRRLCRPGFDH